MTHEFERHRVEPGNEAATVARCADAHGALARARELAEQFRATAADVDEAAAFPSHNIELLRASGLLGLLVPRDYGGLGLGCTELVEICQILGASCLSTGMIWGMHSQQVATLVQHGDPALLERVLPAIGRGQCLMGSVTTEARKGGHLLTALAPLQAGGAQLLVERDAPVVTAGAHADAFLITMRSSPEARPNDVTLVFVERARAELTLASAWDTMGMRATESVGLRIRACVPPENLVNGLSGFEAAALATLIPVGHLAWAASWLGGARGALKAVVDLLRDPKRRGSFDLASDLLSARIARIRLRLDTLSAYLYTCLHEYRALVACGGSLERYRDAAFQIHINNLKVLASELAYAAVDELVGVAGLRYGYARRSGLALERVFRDLRSAALMYSNDRLLIANGQLSLLDRRVRLAGGPVDVSNHEPTPA